MTADFFADAAPTSDMDKVERDRWGRPLIKPVDGGKPKAFQRVTTFIKALDDTAGLALWQQRMVLKGIAARPDLLLAAQAHSDDDKELGRICKDALEAAAASSKATIGTAIHRITERLDAGEKFAIPDTVKADVEAYRRATEKIEWLHREKMVVHDDWQLAGTPDGIGRFNGEIIVADLKTGSLWPSSCATQMGVYAHSKLYDINTGVRGDHSASTDRALVIHLAAGSGVCNLVWVDVKAGYEACSVARQVHVWRKRKDLATPYVAPADTDALTALILTAPDEAELGLLWKQYKSRWTDTYTELAKQRKVELAS